jgi:Tfp pilus assembly protein PilO
MTQTTKTVIAAAIVVILAGGFYLLFLGPKRTEASELSEQLTGLQSEVAAEKTKATEARAAKREFPRLYRELVLQGKAVPGDAATPSLLVQLTGIGAQTKTSFDAIELNGSSTEAAPVSTLEAATPTETAASLLPLGAAVGAAGLPAMPYSMRFAGGFFGVADFLEGVDGLVETKDGHVSANGRLITIDSFELKPDSQEVEEDPRLVAEFDVTTYITPLGQGVTAGATSAGPASATTPNLP